MNTEVNEEEEEVTISPIERDAAQRLVDRVKYHRLNQVIATTTAFYWIIAGIIKLLLFVSAMFIASESVLRVLSVLDFIVFVAWFMLTWQMMRNAINKFKLS